MYKHGIPLFRSLFSLLRVLPAWKVFKRLRRRGSGAGMGAGKGREGMGIRLRVAPAPGDDPDNTHILTFCEYLPPPHI
jgi:autophagy-related protein 13